MKDITHAVGIIFENERDEILILLRHKQDPEGGTWGLVGGKVDPGETIEQTAKREIEEEINHTIDPEKLQFLKRYDWDRSDIQLQFDVFKLLVKQDEVTLELADNENTEYKWIKTEGAYKRKDLMIGLYPILEDVYNLHS